MFRTLVLELKLEVLIKAQRVLVAAPHLKNSQTVMHTLTHMFLECSRTLVSTLTLDSPHSLFVNQSSVLCLSSQAVCLEVFIKSFNL